MQLKVVLPSGEVNVPVEEKSTPGHLKENLKYSLRIPPKMIRLTCEGRELDDMKPLVGEPNNVTDGAVLVAEAREGGASEEPKAEKPTEKQPMMIKKEEPPKPKKPRKEEMRPVLSKDDVVKKATIKAGSKPWKPEWLEGKQEKRHLAFARIEALQDSDTKTYPEQEDGNIVLALGDQQISPVWTAAMVQMEIGEVADFTVGRKLLDFDPEGLAPTDSCATWRIELVNVAEAWDLKGDFTQLMHVEEEGAPDRAEDLDNVAVHWRVRRWMAEGLTCIASSRERIAILPGYGLVPIEDRSAPPVEVAVGEGQQEAVEAIAMKVGPRGMGHMYLKSEAMKGNRPQGCVVVDVEVVGLDQNRGPGSPGWRGWQSLHMEREMGDQWLQEADERRKQLETFETLSKSTGQTKDAEAHVATQVAKFAKNAARRYGRTLKWIMAEDQSDAKLKLEKANAQMRLAKASALEHQRFGSAAEADTSTEEKEVLKKAIELLSEVLAAGEEEKKDNLVYECLKATLQVHIQAQAVAEARQVLERLQGLRLDDDELKSDSARINRMEGVLNLKKGAGAIEDVQKDLQAAVAAQDKPKVTDCLSKVGEMIKTSQVTWDTVKTLKVGKDVGNAMKMGDPDIALQARKIVQEIQSLAQRAGIGL